VEKIYRDFEKRKLEAMRSPEFQDKEIGPEKEKEILREVVSEQIKEAQAVSVSDQQAIIQNASQIKSQPKERQIQFLINLALEKGISEAVHTAKSLESPYIIDELHDALTDNLYHQLVKEGKLKEI
jgi:predicted house-cleaning NTP pyrophosphatase (Maf/HAM1 superfamily)